MTHDLVYGIPFPVHELCLVKVDLNFLDHVVLAELIPLALEMGIFLVSQQVKKALS